MTSTSPRTIDYWSESRRPLASLIFLLPLLAVYECGIRWSNGEQIAAVQNGADTWMRIWLLQAGVDRPWVLPLLIIAVLLACHVVGKHPWRISMETFIGMFSESLLGAIVLLVLGQVLSIGFRNFGWMPADVVEAAIPSHAATAVGFVGAGIYEEVLFRLLLLPLAYCALRLLLIPRRWAAVTAVITTSVVFSLAHYIEPSSGSQWPSLSAFSGAAEHIVSAPETWFGCGFRMLAGVVFAALFLVRGFGITVGCHVLYDLLVGMLIAPEA